MKKLHLFIIFLSEAAIYHNGTETSVDLMPTSVRILNLFMQDWSTRTSDEKTMMRGIMGNFRYECVAVPISNIKLSLKGFNLSYTNKYWFIHNFMLKWP